VKLLVLAGGVGTRLWPLSRTEFPKQFLRFNQMDKSIFQMTIDRCLALGVPEDIYVLTQKGYRYLVQNQLDAMGCAIPPQNILYEPQMKNTLPAIYNGVLEIARQEESTVAVLTSDHLVTDVSAFIQTIKQAAPLANEAIITFGVVPTGPETGYGYICPGAPCGSGFKVKQFREKPSYETALQYVKDGYFWNSGLFMFNSTLFCQEVEKYAPEVLAAFDGATTEEAFEATPSISIDYGLLEYSDKVAVVPLKSDWNDLGSFTAFYDAYSPQADEKGNICADDAILIDAAENLVYFDSHKTVALVGVESLVVVDQKDALLICNKNETQKVKEVVQQLTGQRNYRADHHLTQYRPWGSFTVLEEGSDYKLKRLTVLPGKKLSYQKHYHRSEHWIVVQGTALVTLEGEIRQVNTGENSFIAKGQKHRIENPGKLMLEVIEVQTGEYLGEDDIVRFEDDFGREG